MLRESTLLSDHLSARPSHEVYEPTEEGLIKAVYDLGGTAVEGLVIIHFNHDIPDHQLPPIARHAESHFSAQGRDVRFDVGGGNLLTSHVGVHELTQVA